MVLNLSNFIYSLLLENETVIIPGVGAFVSTYNPAVILGNEIKPPSKEISFNQQIKNNDGMLAEIIARRAKISQSYAMKRIEKARENMLYELDKGETVIVENIGTLVYNENNDIIFTPFQDENLLLNSFGLETISTGDSIQKTDIIEVETTLEEEVVQSGIIDENESEPVSTTKEEKSGAKGEAVNNSFVEKESELNQEEEPEKVQITEFKTVGKPKRQEEKKKVEWYWYLLILIPIFIGGFFMLNNKSETKETVINAEKKVSISQQDIQAETVISSDSVQNNSLEPVESDSLQKISTEAELSKGASKYYVVGAGFKDEENVEKYILKLKEKGINGFNLGQKGSLYLVGVDSFDNETDAQELLNKLVKVNPGWNLWIYEK